MFSFVLLLLFTKSLFTNNSLNCMREFFYHVALIILKFFFNLHSNSALDTISTILLARIYCSCITFFFFLSFFLHIWSSNTKHIFDKHELFARNDSLFFPSNYQSHFMFFSLQKSSILTQTKMTLKLKRNFKKFHWHMRCTLVLDAI